MTDLQRILLTAAPHPLTQACCVKRLGAGTLTLLAENAAIAAKLKQLAPRLLAAYVKQGCEVTAIKVEVQVGAQRPPPPEKRVPKRLSIDAIEELERLAHGLENTPLQQALLRLAARQRPER